MQRCRSHYYGLSQGYCREGSRQRIGRWLSRAHLLRHRGIPCTVGYAVENRYDHALSEGTPLDDDLSQHIAAKRSEAEAFVLARLGARGSRLPESYRSKRRHHKSLIGIAIGVIVLLVTVFGQCHSPVDDLGRFQAPPSWEKFPSRMPKSKCRPKWS